MASTCSQILAAIQARIEAIDIPAADMASPDDMFIGTIGPLDANANDRSFALQPTWPDRSLRIMTGQAHECDVVLMIAYAQTDGAWARAADDGSLVTEALWGCADLADLQTISIGPGRIFVGSAGALYAQRQFSIEWRRSDT